MAEETHLTEKDSGNTEEASRILRNIGLAMIITGSLYAFYSLLAGLYMMFFASVFGSGSSVFPSPGGDFNPFTVFKTMRPVLFVTGGEKLLTGVLSVAAIVAGAGMMQYKKWGRRFSQIWAVSALAALVAGVILHVLVIVPSLRKMYLGMIKTFSGIEGAPDMSSFFENMVPFAVQWSTMMVIAVSLVMALLPGLTLHFLREFPLKNFHD